jgi:hypothetical protein
LPFDTGTHPIGVGSCATGGITDTKTVFTNTVLAPKGSLLFRLLSPQHYAQENYARGIDKRPRETLNPTPGLDHTLSWADKQFTAALIHSGASHSEFASFVSLVDAPNKPAPLFGHSLSWTDKQITVTASLTTGSNIALINSSASHGEVASFVSLVGAPDEPVVLFGHPLIPGDDDDFDADEPATTSKHRSDNVQNIPPINSPAQEGEHEGGNEGGHEGENEGGPPTSATTQHQHPHIVSFPHRENCMLIVENVEGEKNNLDKPNHELLLYHYRLGHGSFTTLQAMAKAGILPTRLATCRVPQRVAYHYGKAPNLQALAKAGILPTRLATCRIPQCTAYHYGMASKVPWRVKGDPNDGKLFKATVAGQIVSVDQL